VEAFGSYLKRTVEGLEWNTTKARDVEVHIPTTFTECCHIIVKMSLSTALGFGFYHTSGLYRWKYENCQCAGYSRLTRKGCFLSLGYLRYSVRPWVSPPQRTIHADSVLFLRIGDSAVGVSIQGSFSPERVQGHECTQL
jgi:hypothetical protein